MKRFCVWKCVLACLVVSFTPALQGAEVAEGVTFGGWIRADYGSGERYEEGQGEDTLGVSQVALLGKWSRENVEAVVLVGGTNLTEDGSDGDIGIKDAFIVWKEIGGSDFSLSVGAQPLLFGLKPNGFPGDRSLQPSIEYGGAGGFAVAQQAGPSVIAAYRPTDHLQLRVGAFDTSSSTAAYFADTGLGEIEGSTLSENVFAELDLGRQEGGPYASLGLESRYVGEGFDSSEPIIHAGVGYRHSYFDLSVEYIQIDQVFTGTATEEVYSIAELAIFPAEPLTIYFDYARAEEIEAETFRGGLKYLIQEGFRFMLEYSLDDFGDSRDEIDSVDARLELSF